MSGFDYTKSIEDLVGVVQELSRSRSLDEIQTIVRSAARRLTGADGATFVLRDGDRCFYADEDAIAPLWKGMRFPMSACISGWAMLNGQAAVIEDIYSDDRIPADAYRPTFVKSLVMVPIRRTSPVGAIGNYWATRRMPSDSEVKLLQALADSTSIAMENVSLYQQLEQRVIERSAALELAREAEAAARRELDERIRAEQALRQAECELRQAQKMEAIGQLAGGVAHDFNNILCAILGFGGLVLADLEPEHPVRADVEEMCKAGERAASLTRQLLSFSRRKGLESTAIDLNEVVGGLEKMLRRLIRESVELQVALTPGLDLFRGDPGQIEQILLNLVVNARDAITAKGRVVVETRNVHLDEEYVADHAGVSIGDYVMLAVSDSGIGMDKTTQSRIFEPFFTTKESGRGTGLGLSTVAAIVKELGGHIWMYSEVGRGTVFKIYFPKASCAREAAVEATVPAARLGGHETVLVAEDNAQVRLAVHEILSKYGYTVLEGCSAEDAIRVSDQSDHPIDVLLTDLVMPGMGGPELAASIARSRPAIKVICMSGYTDEAISWRESMGANAEFLEKPITPAALLQKVRQVVRGEGRPNRGVSSPGAVP